VNFELSDDQRMLKDSLDRLITGEVSGETITDLGLTMLPFPEEQGGLGLGAVEMMLVGEAFGRGLVAQPYLGNVVMAGMALRVAGLTDCIAGLAEGTKQYAFVDNPEFVLGGDTADSFIVADGNGFRLIEADAVERRSFKLHNGWGAAAITVAAQPLARITDKKGVAQAVEQAAIAWLAANAVGAMSAAFDLTADYLKTREQFGKPIGANQALQHRMAEMLVELEAARSMALYAAQMIDEPDTDERARAFAAVKLVVNKAARFVGQQAVQLHGGIGVAEEHAIGRYFKHLTVIEMLFGDSDHHAAVLAGLDGFTGAKPHWDNASAQVS
jgi:alkylation response protein AidB-like acyl-CoA dehydrogenase